MAASVKSLLAPPPPPPTERHRVTSAPLVDRLPRGLRRCIVALFYTLRRRNAFRPSVQTRFDKAVELMSAVSASLHPSTLQLLMRRCCRRARHRRVARSRSPDMFYDSNVDVFPPASRRAGGSCCNRRALPSEETDENATYRTMLRRSPTV